MVKAVLYTSVPALAAGFLKVAAEEEDIEVIAVSGAPGELISAIQDQDPTVVLLDLTQELDCGLLAELRRHCPNTNFVLWAHSISLEFAHNAKAIGVRGILRKELPNELLIRCLRKVSEGELWFERTLLTSLLGAKAVRLSPRESQLLRLVSQGLSNKQVATTLSIAEGTVKVYFSKLFRKVGVNDRFELALYGLRNLGTPAEANDPELAGRSIPRSLLIRNPALQ